MRDCREALRQTQRSRIEQAGCLIEDRIIDFDRFATQAAETPDSVFKQRGGRIVAEKVQQRFRRYAEAESCLGPRADQLCECGAKYAIFGIVPAARRS